MKIAILNYEGPWFALATTSLIKSIIKSQKDCQIHFFTTEDNVPIFKYHNKINLISGYTSDIDQFDQVINYSPSIAASNFCANINAKEKFGFTETNGHVTCLDKNAVEFYDVLYCKQKTSKCIFQIIFKLANRIWRGEGYSLTYYPKNQTIKTNTGIMIVNKDLREYVRKNLTLRLSETYFMPNKNNLYKKFDEINRCMNIITDDMFTMHAAISLRKNVEFLDVENINYKLEFFGKGNHHRITDGTWTNKTEQDRSKKFTQQHNSQL